MDLKEKARFFAIKAHMGQVRKNEPDKPMIMHPINVGMLLEEYGYDDAVVAAGYLHDVVEDTKFGFNDIEKEFGREVADLVKGASEPDKSLSWEERKTYTIENTRSLSLRNKLVICADKISNLEDLLIQFQKNGNRDFSAFKRGEYKQKWYYTSVYKSLIEGENENLPIFKRLKEILDKVFYSKEDLYLRDVIFDDNKLYYEKLKSLHAQKMELKKLKKLCSLAKPFVIEFSGSPRTGKTTTIHNLYDFFKKGGFEVSIVEEFTTSNYYKEKLKPKLSGMSLGDHNLAIAEYVYDQLLKALKSEKEIILIDRSLNDRQIWNYMRYISLDMTESKYFESRDKYQALSRELIDFLVVTYADPLISLKRDYNSSLALEKRSFLNVDNLEAYNRCLNELMDLFGMSVEDFMLLDTSSIDVNDVAIIVASEIMPAMRNQYIKSFKKKYDLKD